MAALSARHIQDFSNASSVEKHWGYADRVVPCTNDAGSCEYLDVVYHAADLSNIYSGILWATILGLLSIWGLFRLANRKPTLSASDDLQPSRRSVFWKLKTALAAAYRRHLLPEGARPIFGRTTRLQVLILATLTGYLTIWSFVGITYKTWITPVKKYPDLHNTRTSLGPWSDRIGVLAFALTPLSVMLSSRESLLSIITGVPYQSFNFLHRWLGYIIFVQSALHTIGWCIIEIRLYQPQPSTSVEWIKQTYMIWGVVAMIVLTLLFILSTPWAIRRTGYEFFRKSHYVMAMLYIGACWGHWAGLNCWMIASLVIWVLDRVVRLLRTALIHRWYYSGKFIGLLAAEAHIEHFPDADNGDVIRLNFKQKHCDWQIGQHFYLCFPELSIWQSHPFTPASIPLAPRSGPSRHTYIVRAKNGATKQLADLARRSKTRQAEGNSDSDKLLPEHKITTSVLLSGPNGVSTISHTNPQDNILCIAGGTGVTFILPVLLNIAQQARTADKRVELVWAIRRRSDMVWIQPELDQLRASGLEMRVRIFVTREKEDEGPTSRLHGAQPACHGVPDEKAGPIASTAHQQHTDNSIFPSTRAQEWSVKSLVAETGIEASTGIQSRHPDLTNIVRSFLDETVRGRTVVYASGPGGMVTDLRTAVAACNDPSKIWRGDERFDVELVCDDRLEW